MLIALVGDTRDLTLQYVGWRARRRGCDVLELDESALGESWHFDLAARGHGDVTVRGRSHPLDALAGVAARMHPWPRLRGSRRLSLAASAFARSERRSGIYALLSGVPGVVANRPWAGRSNGSKPLHMQELSAWGFAVPPWIATNDADLAADFVTRSPAGAVFKSVSGLRSRVAMADGKLRRTMREGTAPVVIQEYVPGGETRVHVVNERLFGTRVTSRHVDYRYGHGGSFARARIPTAVAELCVGFAQAQDLEIAGFDFRVARDGRWFCLEANPLPTFLPYELATGQPIADALLDSMAAGGGRPRRAASRDGRISIVGGAELSMGRTDSGAQNRLD